MKAPPLCLALLALLGAAACAPLPPARNPPPALAAPVALEVRGTDATPSLFPAALLAARRLNESRGPSERPVRVRRVLAPGPLLVAAVRGDQRVILGLSGTASGGARPDPLLPPALVDLPAAWALYDAVVTAGLVARRLPNADAQGLVEALGDWEGAQLSAGFVRFGAPPGDANPTLRIEPTR